ncbi:MAG: CIA30 family protein, partial [Microcystis sp.]
YKLILRCEGRWDGIGYCYSFDTLDRTLQKISIPFGDLIPVLRAKTLREAAPFDSSSVYALQLMQSKFEYDGALNPTFRTLVVEIKSCSSPCIVRLLAITKN